MLINPMYGGHFMRSLSESYDVIPKHKFSGIQQDLFKHLSDGNPISLKLSSKLTDTDILSVLLSDRGIYERYTRYSVPGEITVQACGVRKCRFSPDTSEHALLAEIPLTFEYGGGRDDNERAYYLTEYYREDPDVSNFWKTHEYIRTIYNRIAHGEPLTEEDASNLSDFDVGVLVSTGVQYMSNQSSMRCTIDEVQNRLPNEYVWTLTTGNYTLHVYIKYLGEDAQKELTQQETQQAYSIAKEICSNIPTSLRQKLNDNNILAALEWANK